MHRGREGGEATGGEVRQPTEDAVYASSSQMREQDKKSGKKMWLFITKMKKYKWRTVANPIYYQGYRIKGSHQQVLNHGNNHDTIL